MKREKKRNNMYCVMIVGCYTGRRMLHCIAVMMVVPGDIIFEMLGPMVISQFMK